MERGYSPSPRRVGLDMHPSPPPHPLTPSLYHARQDTNQDADPEDLTGPPEAPDDLTQEQTVATDNTRFADDDEELDDDNQAEEQSVGARKGDKPVCSSAGAESIIDCVNMIMVTQGEVISEGSPGQRPGFKFTGDKATLKQAPKGMRGCTSLILQLLCFGAKVGDWSQSVKHMVSKPQSCARAFVVRLFFGADDRLHMAAHAKEHMEECVKLQDGMDLDLPMQRRPWTYTRAPRTTLLRNGVGCVVGEGTLHKRPLDTAPGTKANWRMGNIREILVTAVRILPSFMFSFDGATTLSGAGVSLKSNHADPFTNERSDDMGSFHRIYYLRRGRSLTSVAEELKPGCSALDSPMHWFVAYLCSINATNQNSELQANTREPRRENRKAHMNTGVGRHAAKVQRMMKAQGKGNSKDNGNKGPYVDKIFRDLKYDHDNFVPMINGGGADAATCVSTCDGLIRVPVSTTLFERDLPNAIWAEGDAEKSGCSVIRMFGMCIIHAAMRTCESCLRGVLLVASTRYIAGKGKDRQIINTRLNVAVWEDIRVRKLISVNNKGQLNKVTLNGEEVSPRRLRIAIHPRPHARTPARPAALSVCCVPCAGARHL